MAVSAAASALQRVVLVVAVKVAAVELVVEPALEVVGALLVGEPLEALMEPAAAVVWGVVLAPAAEAAWAPVVGIVWVPIVVVVLAPVAVPVVEVAGVAWQALVAAPVAVAWPPPVVVPAAEAVLEVMPALRPSAVEAVQAAAPEAAQLALQAALWAAVFPPWALARAAALANSLSALPWALGPAAAQATCLSPLHCWLLLRPWPPQLLEAWPRWRVLEPAAPLPLAPFLRSRQVLVWQAAQLRDAPVDA